MPRYRVDFEAENEEQWLLNTFENATGIYATMELRRAEFLKGEPNLYVVADISIDATKTKTPLSSLLFTPSTLKHDLRVDAFLEISKAKAITIHLSSQNWKKIAQSRRYWDSTPVPISSAIVQTESIKKPVSREMLSLHSPYWETMFYGGFTENSTTLIQNNVFSALDFEEFYERLLYASRKRPSSIPEAIRFITLGSFYQVDDVVAKGQKFLLKTNTIRTLDDEAMLELILLADSHGLSKLLDRLLRPFDNVRDLWYCVRPAYDQLSRATIAKIIENIVARSSRERKDSKGRKLRKLELTFNLGRVVVLLSSHKMGKSIDQLEVACEQGSVSYRCKDAEGDHAFDIVHPQLKFPNDENGHKERSSAWNLCFGKHDAIFLTKVKFGSDGWDRSPDGIYSRRGGRVIEGAEVLEHSGSELILEGARVTIDNALA